MSIFTFDTYFDVKFQHLSVHGRQADHGNLNVKILLQKLFLEYKKETCPYTEMDL